MKKIRHNVVGLGTFLGVCATLAWGQVGGPPPVCVTQFTVIGGACSGWVDTTDPEVCPDFVVTSDDCTNTANAATGYAERTGYFSACEMQQRSWSEDLNRCLSQFLPPKNFRCYEATGAACPGGCGGGC